MASGTITGNTSRYTRVDIAWWSSPGNGGSTVTATVKIVHSGRFSYSASKSCSVTINGVTKSSSTLSCGRVSSAGTFDAISNSVWVPYTGDKTIYISGNVNLSGVSSGGGSLGNRDTGGNATLDKIGSRPSVPTVTGPKAAIISETGGSILVTWNKSSSYNGSGAYDVEVSVNGGNWTSITKNLGINTTSYLYHYNAGQGNTYRFAVECLNDVGGSGFSFSDTVTTNSLSAPTIGEVTTYNPYVTPALTVDLSGGGQSNGQPIARLSAIHFNGRSIFEMSYDADNLNNTSQSMVFPADEFAKLIGPNAYSSDKFQVVAWNQNANGTRSGYANKWFTVNLNSDGGAVPTIAAPTLSGGAFNNPSTCFIEGISTLGVSSPDAVVRRAPSETTVTYSISCTGMSTQNGQTASFANLPSGTKTITVTATDSRGLSATATTTCIVQSYFPPSIKSIRGERLTDPNTSAKVIYTISYSPIYANGTSGTDLNTISTQQYKINNLGDWNNYTSGTVITDLSTERSYMVFVRVADKLKSTAYSETSVLIPTIKSGLAIRKHGIGIGVIPKEEFALDVGGKARFESDVVYVAGGRDRTPVTMLTGSTSGDGIKIEAGGTVVVGSGTSPTKFISGSGLNATTKTTYITSDNNIKFETNLGDIYDNRREFTMTANGQMIIPSHLNLGGRLKLPTTVGSWDIGIPPTSETLSMSYINGSGVKGSLGIDVLADTETISMSYINDSGVVTSETAKLKVNMPLEAPSFNGYVFDFMTQNQTDTWVLVKKEEKIQHLWIGWSPWYSCGTNACGVTLKYRYNEALRLCELNWDGLVNSTIGGNTMGFMWTGFPADKKPHGNMFIHATNSAADAGLVIRYYPITNDVTQGNFTLTSLRNNINDVYTCGFYMYSYANKK